MDKILFRPMRVFHSAGGPPVQGLRCHRLLVPRWTPGLGQMEPRPGWQTGCRGHGLRPPEHPPGFHVPVPVFPGGPGSAHCPPSPREDSHLSDLPDQPIEALGLSAPIRAYHNGSPMPTHPCLQPHSIRSNNGGGGRCLCHIQMGSNPGSATCQLSLLGQVVSPL